MPGDGTELQLASQLKHAVPDQGNMFPGQHTHLDGKFDKHE